MNQGRPRILVADDLSDAADLAAELLRLAGYEAAAAYNGLQAVESARVFNPDLVILDIDMPVMDGYAAARALRLEQSPGTRLVLIAHTGRTRPADVELALAAGFDRHVIKPLAGNALCEMVAAYLPWPSLPQLAPREDSSDSVLPADSIATNRMSGGAEQ